jgi:hypothetical protein
VKAAVIMQEADQPMKQNTIQWLTLNLTNAYTDTTTCQLDFQLSSMRIHSRGWQKS